MFFCLAPVPSQYAFATHVRRSGLARPVRANLTCSVAALGDDEVHHWRIRLAKFILIPDVQAVSRYDCSFQNLKAYLVGLLSKPLFLTRIPNSRHFHTQIFLG